MKYRFFIIGFISSLFAISDADFLFLQNDRLLDIGYGWDRNSTDKSEPFINYINTNEIFNSSCKSFDGNTNYFYKNIGIVGVGYRGTSDLESVIHRYQASNLVFSPYIFLMGRYNKNWKMHFLLRASSDKDSMVGYGGVPRDIERFGFETAEIGRSTISYSNTNFSLGYGRGNVIWGGSFNDNVILSGLSPAFERVKLDVSFKKVRFGYFYGFLESVISGGYENNVRYLTGKFYEYSNRKNFIISMGEIVTLYGKNRGIDYSYLNPISFHLENEQNDRTLESNGNRENAIWFLHADSFIMNRIRIYLELIVDEFQLDQEDRDEGRGDALGSKIYLSWNKKINDKFILFNFNYLFIGTYTYQHQNGLTNFVNRNHFLGYRFGNDIDKLSMSISMIGRNMISSFSFSQIRLGQNNLFNSFYDPFISFIDVPFPSGDFSTENIIGISLKILGSKNYNILYEGQYVSSEDFTNYGNVSVVANVFFN